MCFSLCIIMCLCLFVCFSLCICVFVCLCVSVCLYVSLFVCVFQFVYMFLCLFVCFSLCIYICVFVCLFVCVYFLWFVCILGGGGGVGIMPVKYSSDRLCVLTRYIFLSITLLVPIKYDKLHMYRRSKLQALEARGIKDNGKNQTLKIYSLQHSILCSG